MKILVTQSAHGLTGDGGNMKKIITLLLLLAVALTSSVYSYDTNYNGYFAKVDEDKIIDVFGDNAVYGEYYGIKAYRINIGLNGLNLYNNAFQFILNRVTNTGRPFSSNIGYIRETMEISKSGTGGLRTLVNSTYTDVYPNDSLNANDVYLFIIGVSNYAEEEPEVITVDFTSNLVTILIPLVMYLAFLFLRFFKGIAIFDLLAIVPIIVLITSFINTDLDIMVYLLGLMIFIHVVSYYMAIKQQ